MMVTTVLRGIGQGLLQKGLCLFGGHTYHLTSDREVEGKVERVVLRMVCTECGKRTTGWTVRATTLEEKEGRDEGDHN